MLWQKWGYVFAGLILLCVEVCWSQNSIIRLQPSMPTVGGTVILLFDYNYNIYNVNWYRGAGSSSEINIGSYSPNSSYPAVYGPLYTGRETILRSGALQISNLMANDSGIYTLEITSPNGLRTWNIELNVHSASQNGNISSPATNSPGMDKGVVAGIAVGVIVAFGLAVAGLVIWMKKCRSSMEPIYETENPKAEKPKNNNFHQSEAQRFPSLPPRNIPTNYMNNLGNDAYANDINDENPYTDLDYIYVSGGYHDLRRGNQ